MEYPWEIKTTAPPRRFTLDFTYAEWEARILSWGFKRINAKDLFRAIHRKRMAGFEEEDRQRLPRPLLKRLESLEWWRREMFSEVHARPSADGSVKYVFTLDRDERVESVFMPSPKRDTLCISSQVGCALGCGFCATGAMGFRRHLSPGEMVGQVYHMLGDHRVRAGRERRLNVVFMGMGEPLHNFENVMKTFDILTHANGLVLSPRDVAVSTSGLVPKIRQLAACPNRPQLMVSIAATTDEERSAIMPVNRAYSLQTLCECLAGYPLRRRERIMLSYVLIAGINDRPADADRLAAMSRRFPSLVNLIPMNAHAHSPGMREPDENGLQRFYKRLTDQRVFTTIRRSRGRDVAAACGQLTARSVAVPLPSA